MAFAHDDAISLFQNRGQLSNMEETRATLAAHCGGPISLAVGDLDGDGDMVRLFLFIFSLSAFAPLPPLIFLLFSFLSLFSLFLLSFLPF